MTTIKSTLRMFAFDTSTPEGKTAWAEFKAARKAENYPHEMESLGNSTAGDMKTAGFYWLPDLDGAEVELETAHLFENQWNAAPIPGDTSENGRRLFDWAIEVSYPYNNGARSPWRRGHYLVQTGEMREIRRNTYVCGYCGHPEAAAKGSIFCPKCIGSEYLKESDLHLTRMQPVDAPFSESRAPLTDAERAHLMPLYVHAQTHGNTERDKARIANKRASVLDKYERVTRNAATERDGFLWLMDHGIKTDNVIFYSHTGRFGFGWWQPLGAEVLAALLEATGAEFPFPYDIVTADGRKLSAGA